MSIAIDGLKSLDMFITHCPECKHMTIHGFYQQLDWELVEDGNYVETKLKCKKCPYFKKRKYPVKGFKDGEGI